jgi:hypothetical protein
MKSVQNLYSQEMSVKVDNGIDFLSKNLNNVVYQKIIQQFICVLDKGNLTN